MATSVILILGGLACLALSGFAMYAVVPRDGKPAPAWTRTDTRATSVALGLLTLIVFGAGLLVKGIFA